MTMPMQSPQKVTFISPLAAFKCALLQGRLSRDKASPRYYAHYMYMGTYQGRAAFKHKDTREYIA